MIKEAEEERIMDRDVAVFRRWRKADGVKGEVSWYLKHLQREMQTTAYAASQDTWCKSWGSGAPGPAEGGAGGWRVEHVTSQHPTAFPASVAGHLFLLRWQRTQGFPSEKGIERVHQVPSSTMKAKKAPLQGQIRGKFQNLNFLGRKYW